MQPDHMQHPEWYPDTADFAHPRYAFPLRVGHQAGSVSGNDWSRVESALREVWLVLHDGLTWEQARPVIYHGWLRAKRGAEA